MRSSQSALYVGLAISFLVVTGAGASTIADVLDPFLGAEVVLRPRVNDVTHFYLNDQWGTYWVIEDDRHYLYRDETEITIEAYEIHESPVPGISIRFSEAVIGNGVISVLGPSTNDAMATVLPTVLEHMLVSSESQGSALAYVVDSSSGIIHSAVCNHLPASYVAADSLNGDAACGFCFRSELAIEDYDLEMLIGTHAFSQFRMLHRVIERGGNVARVASIGDTVLSRWPFHLTGFEYEFLLVEGREPNAFACPGGKVLVTTGLVNSMQDDDQLEAVLAHEVAHIELRSGLNRLKKMQKSAKWASIGAAVAGAAVGAATDDAKTGLAVSAAIGIIAEYATSLAFAGYSREDEASADFITRIYLEHNSMPVDGYASVLKSIEYAHDVHHGDELLSALDSHPPTGTRLSLFENLRVATLDGAIAGGLLEVGEGEIEVRILAIVSTQRLRKKLIENEYGDWTHVPSPVDYTFLLLEARSDRGLGGPVELKDVTIGFDGSDGSSVSIKFDHEFDPVLYPCESRFLVYGAREFKFEEHRIESIELNLN